MGDDWVDVSSNKVWTYNEANNSVNWSASDGGAGESNPIELSDSVTSIRIRFKNTLKRTDSESAVKSVTRFSAKTAYRVKGSGGWNWAYTSDSGGHWYKDPDTGKGPLTSELSTSSSSTYHLNDNNFNTIKADHLRVGDVVVFCHIFRYYKDVEVEEKDDKIKYHRDNLIYVPNKNYSNKYSCVTAKKVPSQFSGRSRVGSSESNLNHNTAWTNTGRANAKYSITNCSDSGCSATIAHGLKRNSGEGATAYTITRDTNIPMGSLPGGSGASLNSGHTENFSGTSNGSGVRERTTTYTLKPGQYVCETITFKPNNNEVSPPGDVSTTACAFALPTPAASGLSISVLNEDVDAYSNWTNQVYAKPKDTVDWRATYNATAQKYASNEPQKMVINGGKVCTEAFDSAFSGTAMSSLLSTCGGGTWANGFTISGNDNPPYGNWGFYQNYTYGVGEVGPHSPDANKHKIAAAYAGATLTEIASTNSGVSKVPKETGFGTRCLPGTVKNEKGEDITVENCYLAGLVNTADMSGSASVLVPYNFENTTKMTTCNKEDMERYGMSCNDATGSDGSTNDSATMYAGESKSMAFKLITSTRQNNVTDGDYATIVRDALYRVRTCVGARCDSDNWDYVTSDKGITLNGITANYANYEGSTVSHSIPINIPDEPAGTKMCVRSEVYPKDSGDDKNLSTRYYAVGDINSWSVSKPVCFTIAKKPSMQIWGGSIFFQNNVTTSVAAKGHLAGYNNYLIENGGYTTRYFGSWEELGVVAEGSVDGFSSGASLGFYGNNNGNLSPNPFPSLPNGNSSTWGRPNFAGGSTNSSICNRSPLTFANSPCNSGSKVGLIGNSVASKTAKSDKSKLLGKYAYGDEVNVSGDTVQLNNPAFKKNGNVYYYHGNGALTVGDPTADTVVDKNTIQIVHTTSNIYIQGNIIYSDTAASETFATLPKLVIFAEGNNDSHGNIRIDCNVKRIDALIIGHVVNTCADDYGNTPGVNAKERANQLIINGTVVADKLRPSRTYGAATGANSIVPAEIINYDSTLYLWGGNDSESSGDDSTNMDITYQKEVAPRL